MKSLALSMVILSVVACGGRGDREIIQNKGSDTLVNVAQAWAEEYKDVKPGIAITVTGGGSGTGISALINGTAHIANCSRRMKPREIEDAKKKGFTPVEFEVGYDALAVFLHKDNPIESLTLAQLAAIYGQNPTITKWSQLGVQLGGNNDEIVRVSRQNNSGTYMYFQEAVLGKGNDYELGTLDMNGSKEVVDLVEKTPGAIGYSGLAYATKHVKLAKIARAEGDEPVAPSVKTAVDKTYPISRPLFMYTPGEPEGKVKEYINWIRSAAGQKIIEDKGYAPIPLEKQYAGE